MPDKASDTNGALKWRQPGVPTSIVIVSLIVGVGAVSVLIYVLFRQTTGPGQVLKRYYTAISDGDCGTAYSLLSPTVQQAGSRATYCSLVWSEKGHSPTDFSVETIKLHGPKGSFADVTVKEEGPGALSSPVDWQMQEVGGLWKIVAGTDGTVRVPIPAAAAP